MYLLNLLFNPAFIGVLALFLAVIWMLRDQHDKSRAILVLALALNLFYGFLLTTFMAREDGLLPWKFDYILLHMDESLGITAASIAIHLQGPFRSFLVVVYQLMIPTMIAWFFVVQRGGGRGSVVTAYIAEMVTGPVLYAVLPACGPGYAFTNRWLNPPPVPADLIRLAAMPNAFPSLHVGTAFVLLLFAPGKWSRTFALAFLISTILATIGIGEHYVIDLVSGLAFGAFAAAVGVTSWRRAAFFLGIVATWSISIRFASTFYFTHPFVTRAFAVLTVALALLALWKHWQRRPVHISSLRVLSL